MKVHEVVLPGHPNPDLLRKLQENEQRKMEQFQKAQEDEGRIASKRVDRGERKAILDKEIYIPYQAAIDSVLDDTFDEQPIIVQMLQGWMAESFRRFAQKNRSYQHIVIDCAVKIDLKDKGKNFGHIQPKEHRPAANHVFKTLHKLKQIGKPFQSGDIDYYSVVDFPDHIKKRFIYPAIEDSVPGLLKYLKTNKVKLLLGSDFTFTLPVALRTHVDFESAWNVMSNEVGIDGSQIFVANELHKFKFI